MARAGSGRALETISRNAEALTRLVNDVLDTSSVVTGKIRLVLKDCDLSALVNDAIDSITPSTQMKSILVTRDVERGVAVHGDPDRLRQVLWNLLSNAVKFTPQGGSLKVSTASEPRGVRIVVEDSGVGIAPEALPHVFRRFWQADASHTRTHAGLGLGLALARDFVDLHGGHLEVHSDGVGRGARFDVVLPAAGAGGRSPR